MRLRELLTSPDGGICPSLATLKAALTATDPPGTAVRWLAKQPVASVLARITAGPPPPTHCVLYGLDQTPITALICSKLFATRTVTLRALHMAGLFRIR